MLRPRPCPRLALALVASTLFLAACKPAPPAATAEPAIKPSPSIYTALPVQPYFIGPVPFANAPVPDVDAMAARMRTDQDVYGKIRDEALAEYARRNPKPAPYDDKAKAVIRLFACLWTWSDFYGECLGARGTALAEAAQNMGCRDPILQAFLDTWEWSNFNTPTRDEAERLNQRTDVFLETGYPAALKLYACETTLNNMAGYEDDEKKDGELPAMDTREYFVEQWGQNYRELIRQHLPQTLLFLKADRMNYAAQPDETMLDELVAEEERDFNETDPRNPLRMELDASYYVNSAWHDREYVTDDPSSAPHPDYFGLRLQRAKAILDPLYVYYPQEMGTCLVMLKASLGDGGSRFDMDKWFERAMKIDPQSYEACERKEWCLQPRWDGTKEDVLAFARECVKTGNWTEKMPMILVKAYYGFGGNEVYADAAIWAELEPVYREYLRRYPDAVNYRTFFAVHAFDGGHFDTAKEEFTILGNDWDRTALKQDKYDKIRAQLKLP